MILLLESGDGVNIASDMKLSQFDLISTPTGVETTLRNKGKMWHNQDANFSYYEVRLQWSLKATFFKRFCKKIL